MKTGREYNGALYEDERSKVSDMVGGTVAIMVMISLAWYAR